MPCYTIDRSHSQSHLQNTAMNSGWRSHRLLYILKPPSTHPFEQDNLSLSWIKLSELDWLNSFQAGLLT